MTRVRLGSDDPRRFNADTNEERRWERNWEEGRRRDREMEQAREQTKFLQAVLESIPNRTAPALPGSDDRELKLSGTRSIRGRREKAMPAPEPDAEQETFSEWYETVTFATPYPAPPVVLLSVQEFGAPPPDLTGAYALTLHNVGKSGFSFRLTCSPPAIRATVHWRAEGDA